MTTYLNQCWPKKRMQLHRLCTGPTTPQPEHTDHNERLQLMEKMVTVKVMRSKKMVIVAYQKKEERSSEQFGKKKASNRGERSFFFFLYFSWMNLPSELVKDKGSFK